MINAITSMDSDKKKQGDRILKNVEKQLANNRKTKLDNFDLEDELAETYGI